MPIVSKSTVHGLSILGMVLNPVETREKVMLGADNLAKINGAPMPVNQLKHDAVGYLWLNIGMSLLLELINFHGLIDVSSTHYAKSHGD